MALTEFKVIKRKGSKHCTKDGRSFTFYIEGDDTNVVKILQNNIDWDNLLIKKTQEISIDEDTLLPETGLINYDLSLSLLITQVSCFTDIVNIEENIYILEKEGNDISMIYILDLETANFDISSDRRYIDLEAYGFLQTLEQDELRPGLHSLYDYLTPGDGSNLGSLLKLFNTSSDIKSEYTSTMFTVNEKTTLDEVLKRFCQQHNAFIFFEDGQFHIVKGFYREDSNYHFQGDTKSSYYSTLDLVKVPVENGSGSIQFKKKPDTIFITDGTDDNPDDNLLKYTPTTPTIPPKGQFWKANHPDHIVDLAPYKIKLPWSVDENIIPYSNYAKQGVRTYKNNTITLGNLNKPFGEDSAVLRPFPSCTVNIDAKLGVTTNLFYKSFLDVEFKDNYYALTTPRDGTDTKSFNSFDYKSKWVIGNPKDYLLKGLTDHGDAKLKWRIIKAIQLEDATGNYGVSGKLVFKFRSFTNPDIELDFTVNHERIDDHYIGRDLDINKPIPNEDLTKLENLNAFVAFTFKGIETYKDLFKYVTSIEIYHQQHEENDTNKPTDIYTNKFIIPIPIIEIDSAIVDKNTKGNHFTAIYPDGYEKGDLKKWNDVEIEIDTLKEHADSKNNLRFVAGGLTSDFYAKKYTYLYDNPIMRIEKANLINLQKKASGYGNLMRVGNQIFKGVKEGTTGDYNTFVITKIEEDLEDIITSVDMVSIKQLQNVNISSIEDDSRLPPDNTITFSSEFITFDNNTLTFN